MNRQQRREAARAKPQKRNRQVATMAAPVLLSMNRQYTEDELLADNIAVQMAANALCSDNGTDEDFNRLALAFNIVALVAADGNEHLREITGPMLRALISIKKRHEKWGKFDPTAQEKEQLQIGVEMTHELMRHSTPLQIDRAARRLAMLRSKHK